MTTELGYCLTDSWWGRASSRNRAGHPKVSLGAFHPIDQKSRIDRLLLVWPHGATGLLGCLTGGAQRLQNPSPSSGCLVSRSPRQARDTEGSALTCNAWIQGRKSEDLAWQAPQEAGVCSAAKHELACLCLQKSREHEPSQKSERARVSTEEVIALDDRCGLAKLRLYGNDQGTPPTPTRPLAYHLPEGPMRHTFFFF